MSDSTVIAFPFTKVTRRDTYATIDPTREALSAKGKTVLITGGATGIGKETARAFATAGAARVVLVARSVDTLAAAKAELSKSFPSTTVITHAVDICNEEGVKKVFDSLRVDGDVDILILCAAVAHPFVPSLELSTKALQQNLEVNVVGNFTVVKAFLANGKKGKMIINYSTAAIHMIVPGVSAYGASKGAFTHFMDHFHAEFKAEGLRVVQIHPGSHFTGLAASAGITEGMFVPDEMVLPAHTCVWLASSEGTFLDGKYVWVAWDAAEMIERKEEILANPSLLTIGLQVKA